MTSEKEGKLSDVLKKVVNTGIGAAFMTEEAIKEKLGDLSLPKDIVNGLLQNARSTKDEFIGALKNELKDVLGAVNVSDEIQKVVENFDIEVKATFKFKPKEGSKETGVKATKKPSGKKTSS